MGAASARIAPFPSSGRRGEDLRRDHPRFEELHALLEYARRAKTYVLVTESLDSSAIVDVRPAPAGGTPRQ